MDFYVCLIQKWGKKGILLLLLCLTLPGDMTIQLMKNLAVHRMITGQSPAGHQHNHGMWLRSRLAHKAPSPRSKAQGGKQQFPRPFYGLCKTALSAPLTLITIVKFTFLGLRAREETKICSGRENSFKKTNYSSNNTNNRNN